MFGEMKKVESEDTVIYCKPMLILLGNVNKSQADAEICNIIADTLTKCGLIKINLL